MTAILATTYGPTHAGHLVDPLTVTETPANVSGFGNTGSSANITTGLVVVTPAGGVAPYTHSWAQTSTSPYTWVITTPSAASTSFTCNALGPGTTAEATFRDTVTDAAGTTVTIDVEAFANNGQPYDPIVVSRTTIKGPSSA